MADDLARGYAEGILAASTAEGAADRVADELLAFAQAVAGNAQLRERLTDPGHRRRRPSWTRRRPAGARPPADPGRRGLDRRRQPGAPAAARSPKRSRRESRRHAAPPSPRCAPPVPLSADQQRALADALAQRHGRRDRAQRRHRHGAGRRPRRARGRHRDRRQPGPPLGPGAIHPRRHLSDATSEHGAHTDDRPASPPTTSPRSCGPGSSASRPASPRSRSAGSSRRATASRGSADCRARWPTSCWTSAPATTGGALFGIALNLDEDVIGAVLLGDASIVRGGRRRQADGPRAVGAGRRRLPGPRGRRRWAARWTARGRWTPTSWTARAAWRCRPRRSSSASR